MKKILTAFALAIVSTWGLYAQPAVILNHEAQVVVNSPVDVKYSVVERIRINEENMLPLADFVYYTDAFKSISSFSGTIEQGGKVIKKIKQTDLYTRADSDAFADDSFINVYSPSATLPFEVEYKYTISLRKAVASFPNFVPVVAELVPVKHASYVIKAPADYTIGYHASFEPAIAKEKGNSVYTWEINDFPGYVLEHNMPEAVSIVPHVYSCPMDFRFAGTGGSQSSWKEAGAWLHSIEPKDSSLPESMVSTVHRLTEGCTSDLEKLRALYGWLGENTRYVSIQLGIGGYAPMSPSLVCKTGYGDCKALSFLLKKMLEEAGVSSEYVIVSTDRKKVLDNYSSIGQMNHAMLCVPLQKDTVWVECTNPSYPLGYRHEGIAGHQVVLVKDDGGELVNVPDYDGDLKVDSDYAKIELSADGSAHVRATRTRRLESAESYIKFTERERKDIQESLSRFLACVAEDLTMDSFKTNFDEYQGTPDFIPEASVSFHFYSSNLAKAAGDRLFVPAMLTNIGMTSQRGARLHDLVFNYEGTESYNYEIAIPDGFTVDALPESKHLATAFMDLDINFSTEGNIVKVLVTLSNHKAKLQAASYNEYRRFVKDFNKATASTIVLKKA